MASDPTYNPKASAVDEFRMVTQDLNWVTLSSAISVHVCGDRKRLYKPKWLLFFVFICGFAEM